MIRTVLTILMASVLLTVVVGCESGTAEDEKMTKRREPPAEKRPPPGAGMGLEIEAEEGEAPPDAPGGGGG